MALIVFDGKKPQIGDEGFIAPDADIIGDVVLGDGVGIWFHTTLRGDIAQIRVGEMTNIQDNSVVHVDFGTPALIGNYVTVGHGAIIHGCTIGDSCLIGMGSIIMNEAEIGSECIIGAGAVIPQKKRIPPRSLVIGVPGQVVGRVTDEQVKIIIRQAKGYAKRGIIYAQNF